MTKINELPERTEPLDSKAYIGADIMDAGGSTPVASNKIDLGNFNAIVNPPRRVNDGNWVASQISRVVTARPSWGVNDEGGKGLFFPSAIYVKDLLPGALFDWYVASSSDHTTGNYGFHGTDNLLLGPWAEVGPITLPGGLGATIETPDIHPIYDANGNFKHFSLLTHGQAVPTANATQTTTEVIATTDILAGWQIPAWLGTNGIAIDAPSPRFSNGYRELGDEAHTGYARRIFTGGLEIAFHLDHGSLQGYRGVSYRFQAEETAFRPLRKYIRDGVNAWTGSTRNTYPSNVRPFLFRGQMYAVYQVQDERKHATDPTAGSDIYISNVLPGPDFKLGVPVKVLDRSQVAFSNYGLRTPDLVNMGDEYLVLIYSTFVDSDKSDYGLGVARLDLK